MSSAGHMLLSLLRRRFVCGSYNNIISLQYGTDVHVLHRLYCLYNIIIYFILCNCACVVHVICTYISRNPMARKTMHSPNATSTIETLMMDARSVSFHKSDAESLALKMA